MKVFDPLFRFRKVEDALAENSLFQYMLEFEAALARAESVAGIIPQRLASTIAACCKLESLDLKALPEATAKAGNIAIPLIKQLTNAVQRVDPEGAKFVHWGATSQDVIDTATVLQAREVTALIASELDRLCQHLERLTAEHRETVMPGRTWLQHATPTTFGLKTAQMLSSVMSARKKLRKSADEIGVLQFGGAVGTLAALGSKGPQVAEDVSSLLKLRAPTLPWHSNRERFAELVVALGILGGTLGKIARDISLLAQTEISEVSEHQEAGRGSSSTMPQKQNPVGSAAILSVSLRMPGLVSTMLTSMMQEHERGLGGWHAEWEVLPELLSLAGGAAHHSANLIEGLVVHVEKMRSNLELTDGRIYSEAVTFRLAGKIGKPKAHELLERILALAIEQEKHLRDALIADVETMKHLPLAEVSELFDPGTYLGSAQIFIDRVLGEYAAERTNALR